MRKSNNNVLPPETPSILINYKKPMRKVEKGYGYYGALATNIERTHLQCHMCGEFVRSLSHHIKRKHGITAREYKLQFGLRLGTVLVGEKMRESLIAKYNARVTPEMKDKLRQIGWASKERRGKQKRTAWGRQLEFKNLNGTCPDQLLEKIQLLSEEMGRTPNQEHFRKKHSNTYLQAVVRTFGSWTEAVRRAGLKPRSDEIAEQYTPDRLLEYIVKFHENNGRMPSTSDIGRGLMPAHGTYYRAFGGWGQAKKIASDMIATGIEGR